MHSLIAKKYVKGILKLNDNKDFYLEVFSFLKDKFKDENFKNFILSPFIKNEYKKEFFKTILKKLNDEKINKIIDILIENKRLDIIPYIADELQIQVANIKGEFKGFIYSKQSIQKDKVQKYNQALSKKFCFKIDLEYVKNDLNGIKIDIKELGVQMNFSKKNVKSLMIEHILKVIK